MPDPDPVSPSPSPTAPPPLPPPTLGVDDRTNRLLMIAALAGLALAAIMTVLWLGARGGDAEPVVTTPPSTTPDLSDELARTEADLDESRTRLREAEAELAAAQAAANESGGDDAQVAELEAQVVSLSQTLAERDAAVTGLEADVARLQAELDALAGAPAPAPTPDLSDAPEFGRWIGELLSSRTGSSPLGETQSTCLGSEVVARIGLDALGAGQNNAASGAERQVVIDALVAAADACGIDPGLVFG